MRYFTPTTLTIIKKMTNQCSKYIQINFGFKDQKRRRKQKSGPSWEIKTGKKQESNVSKKNA